MISGEEEGKVDIIFILRGVEDFGGIGGIGGIMLRIEGLVGG